MDFKDFELNVNDLGLEITDVLDVEYINSVAKECGFIQREGGKLDGFMFLDIILFTHFNHKELSLNDMSIHLCERYGIEITKQSIDERFNGLAIKFFTKILEKILDIKMKAVANIDFTDHSQVRIKDSTSFQLPECMKEKYPGPGGSASSACIRIQFEYDLKAGKILDLSLNAFNTQDVSNAKETIGNIDENDLIIRDLGYIKIDLLRQIKEKNAYYLNRLHTNVNVYEKKNKKFVLIDFCKLHKHMRKHDIIRVDKTVYIGQEKFETRIIIETLPKSEYEKRIKENKKKEKQTNKNISDKSKAKNGLNIYVTNTKLKGEDIRLLYSLRWQIELMFKIWKSIGEIDKVKKMKVERFETYLIAKLIWIVTNWHIMRLIVGYFFNKEKIEISPYKLYKTLKMYLMDFRTAIINKTNLFFINKIIKMNPKKFISEKKNNSTNWSYEIINMFV